MGEIPITPTTLKNYCELVGVELQKDEAVVILNLSKLYCSEVAEIKESKTATHAPYGYAEIKEFFDARKKKNDEAKKRKKALKEKADQNKPSVKADKQTKT
ncbi:MAG: hypothetical protein K0U41_02040 [Gammaproteobacteria bacterium]|nr:hypothetical protein [Gammaproteobacteria bacterium]